MRKLKAMKLHAGKTLGWAGATPLLTAFSRPKFCGVAPRRPHEWASRSLKREFELVIVVEVLIEEMFRSDRSRPLDYKRAVVVDAEKEKKERKRKRKTLSGEKKEVSLEIV